MRVFWPIEDSEVRATLLLTPSTCEMSARSRPEPQGGSATEASTTTLSGARWGGGPALQEAPAIVQLGPVG